MWHCAAYTCMYMYVYVLICIYHPRTWGNQSEDCSAASKRCRTKLKRT